MPAPSNEYQARMFTGEGVYQDVPVHLSAKAELVNSAVKMFADDAIFEPLFYGTVEMTDENGDVLGSEVGYMGDENELSLDVRPNGVMPNELHLKYYNVDETGRKIGAPIASFDLTATD